jgi:hypothetical protein
MDGKETGARSETGSEIVMPHYIRKGEGNSADFRATFSRATYAD